MSLKRKFWGNARNPRGIFGRYMVKRMNRGRHAILAEWALKDFTIDSDALALDIGCGGGANLARLLERCKHVTGVDHAPLSVAKSRQLNAKEIWGGRCEVVEGDVAALPFEDGSKPTGAKWESIIEGMHTYTPAEIEAELAAAGFAAVSLTRDTARHFIRVVAVK